MQVISQDLEKWLTVVYRKFFKWWIPIWCSSRICHKVMKIAAIVVMLFVVGLSYLSYRGWIDIKWIEIENATRATLAMWQDRPFIC